MFIRGTLLYVHLEGAVSDEIFILPRGWRGTYVFRSRLPRRFFGILFIRLVLHTEACLIVSCRERDF